MFCWCSLDRATVLNLISFVVGNVSDTFNSFVLNCLPGMLKIASKMDTTGLQNDCKEDAPKCWGTKFATCSHQQPIVTYYTLFDIRHSEDCASWYLLIMKANEMHYFSDLFDKILYMFRTGPLSTIRSISKLYTRNRYLSC